MTYVWITSIREMYWVYDVNTKEITNRREIDKTRIMTDKNFILKS